MFTRLPPPFPNYYVASHPRIRVGPDGTLFVMALVKQQTSNGAGYILYVNRYRDGRWGDPHGVTSPVAHYPDIDLGSSVLGAKLTSANRPQFSLTLGTSSDRPRRFHTFMATNVNERGGYLSRRICNMHHVHAVGTRSGHSAFRVDSRESQRLDVFNQCFRFPGFRHAPRWQGSFRPATEIALRT